MSKVFSGHTTMPGVHENPKINTEIMNLLALDPVENYINSMLHVGQISAILKNGAIFYFFLRQRAYFKQ